LKSWNCLLKSDACVPALKKPKKDPVAPAVTDSPPWRSTHPFAVMARLSFFASVAGATCGLVAGVALVDLLETVFVFLIEVELETFDLATALVVPLLVTEVEFAADFPVLAAAVAFFVVSTTVALPPALTVRSSIADASTVGSRFLKIWVTEMADKLSFEF
jgi:hypothetical protein